MDTWSAIHPDLLELIFDRLGNTLNHYVRFGAVCQEWRSLTAEKKRHIIPRIMMMKLLHGENKTNHTVFFSLGCGPNIYEIPLPMIQHKECVGSSDGWLIMVDKVSGQVFLMNPFSKNQILLPSLPLEQNTEVQESSALQKIHSATVSSNSISDSDYLVMVRFWNSRTVLFCRAGDQEWSILTSTSLPMEDIIYFNGKVYAMFQWGDVHIFDLDDPAYPVKIESTIQEIEALKRRENEYLGRVYLVKLQNVLLKIIRYVVQTDAEEWTRCSTVGFEVCMFQEATQDWVSMENLGDQVLFLGMNSVCLRSSEVPECTPNSIYFTDYMISKDWHDRGVFNIEDKSIRPSCDALASELAATIWFSPHLG